MVGAGVSYGAAICSSCKGWAPVQSGGEERSLTRAWGSELDNLCSDGDTEIFLKSELASCQFYNPGNIFLKSLGTISEMQTLRDLKGAITPVSLSQWEWEFRHPPLSNVTTCLPQVLFSLVYFSLYKKKNPAPFCSSSEMLADPRVSHCRSYGIAIAPCHLTRILLSKASLYLCPNSSLFGRGYGPLVYFKLGTSSEVNDSVKCVYNSSAGHPRKSREC